MVFLAYNPLFLALFRQIHSIIIRQKQGFAKILCNCRNYFFSRQILFFPLPSPHSPHLKRENRKKNPLLLSRKKKENPLLSSSSHHTPTISSTANTLFLSTERKRRRRWRNAYFSRVWEGREKKWVCWKWELDERGWGGRWWGFLGWWEKKERKRTLKV